jgi:hypothetical protein
MTLHRLTTSAPVLALAAAGLLLLPGCSSTHIQSKPTPAGLAAAPVHQIMVVGMDQRDYVRTPFESDVVTFLHERGVEGTASCAQFSFDQMSGDRQAIRQRLAAAGAQTALFVRVTDRADYAGGAPASLGGMDWGAVEESRYNAFTTPGGTINTALRIGARLYKVSDGSVLWSGLFDTVVSENADSQAYMRRVAKSIVERLAKDKVIP